MAWLTKSRFLSGLQCHKRLWFDVHQPLETPVARRIPILQGRTFDEVVRELLPGPVISLAKGLPSAIAETKRVLAQFGGHSTSLLHQAAFRAAGLAVITDVLRRRGAEFELVEVKAATEIESTHVADAAFQALVLQRARIPLGRVFLGLVNPEFVLRRAGDYDGLLTEADVTEPVQAYKALAARRALEFQEIMASDSMPAIAVGPHCLTPYPCPFMGRCTAGHATPEYPVDVLPRGGKLVAELLAEGYRDLRDVPAQRFTNEMHRRVFDATSSALAFFDLGATVKLRQLPYPFAFLDFETIAASVPEILGTRPYEQLPFQWSVHVAMAPDELRHAENLAIERFGDFDELTRQLIAALPAAGPVFVYNESFEQRVLLRLADLVPARAAELHAVAGRLVDLLPVVRAAYYHRDMRGSWSIKSVMPTIDAALAYEQLDEVREGEGAQRAFLELRSAAVTPERAKSLRAALLRYCRHDTWVMVVLRRFLCAETLSVSNSPGAAR
jgi:hypothetical protein